VLPDGRAVLYTVYREPLASATVSVYSFESGERKVLIEGATNGRYLRSGHLAFVRERALQVVTFDLERLEVVGSPAMVGDDIGYESESSTLLADVSDTGTLVYVAERDREVPSRLVAIGDDGSRAIVHEELRRYSDPALSPDGRRLALAIDDGHRDVWVLELARGAFTRVTFAPAEDFHPVWMPDGERLIYASGAPDWNMLRMRADGAGQPETVAATPLDEVPGSMLSDGTLVFTRAHPETGFDLWVLPPDDSVEPRPFRQTPFSERTPAFSPDGRWVAYTSDESRRNEVYVEPYPGPGPRVQVSADGGFGPVWARDGRTIYYWSGDTLRAASVGRQAAFPLERSADVITIPRRHISTFHADIDVLPDGRLIVLEPDPSAPPLQIQVVLNWFEEVRRRLP
jgi:serine/threonine-protein kinase